MGLINKVDVVVNGAQDSSKALVEYNTVILKQNIRDSRNMLTQQMMSQMNTKYVIKWAYTIAENIVLPKNCLLEFDGGSIKNDKGNSYTLTGDDTILIYSQELEDVVKGVELEGTFIHKNSGAADEEDITVSDGKLKFKDKPNTDGMGKIILRKNKTFAEQVTQENTIYEIRYEFDLNGEEVVVPEGCVLDFQGGSLNNGKLKCEHLKTESLKGNVQFEGEFTELKHIEIHSNGYDDTEYINNICRCSVNSLIVFVDSVYFIDGDYNKALHCGIYITKYNIFEFNGCTFQQINYESKESKIIKIGAKGVKIINLNIVGDLDTHNIVSGSTDEWNYGIQISSGAGYNEIKNVSISKMTGDAINIFDYSGNGEKLLIENCTFSSAKRGCISLEAFKNTTINNCIFVKNDTRYTEPNFFIDIEPIDNVDYVERGLRVENTVISNCNFFNDKQIHVGIMLQATYSNSIINTSIYGNTFVGNPPINGFLNFPSSNISGTNICRNNHLEVTKSDYGYNTDLGELIGVSYGANIEFDNITVIGKYIEGSKDPLGVRLFCSDNTKIDTKATFNNCRFYDCGFQVFGNSKGKSTPILILNNCFIQNNNGSACFQTAYKGATYINNSSVKCKGTVIYTYDGMYHLSGSNLYSEEGNVIMYDISNANIDNIKLTNLTVKNCLLETKGESKTLIASGVKGSYSMLIENSKLISVAGLIGYKAIIRGEEYVDNMIVRNCQMFTSSNSGFAISNTNSNESELNNCIVETSGARIVYSNPNSGKLNILNCKFSGTSNNQTFLYSDNYLSFNIKNTTINGTLIYDLNNGETYFTPTSPISISGEYRWNGELDKPMWWSRLRQKWITCSEQEALIKSSGTSEERNELSPTLVGVIFFDTTLNKPIWWTGTKWVDATGADV